MTFFAAAAWTLGARLGLDMLVMAVVALQPRARMDAVTLVLCQAVFFLGALFLMLQAHDRDRPLADSLALRPTLASLCLVGAALGLALHPPFDALADLIALRFPPSAEEIAAQTEAFMAVDTLHRSAVILAAGVAAPLVEELFFRGGLYGGLRRTHSTTLTVVATSLLFACSHLSMRNLAPVFGIGLVLSYARAASGSLWPGLVTHMVFNTASILDNFRRLPDAQNRSLYPNVALLLFGLLLSLGLLGAYRTIARRDDLCAKTRKRDRG